MLVTAGTKNAGLRRRAYAYNREELPDVANQLPILTRRWKPVLHNSHSCMWKVILRETGSWERVKGVAGEELGTLKQVESQTMMSP